jgi:hypothetical protein
MRKKCLLLLSTVFICGMAVAQNKTIEVKKTAVPIVIDGDEDAAWAIADTISIWNWGKDKTAPDPTDFQAYFKLLWDDNFLYFFGTISDDYLMSMDKAAELQLMDWEVDSWELYWSPGNSTLADMTEMTQVRLAYANATSADPISSTKQGYSEGNFMNGTNFINAAMKDYGDSYTVEAALDLAVSATAAGLDKIGENSIVGFNAIASDIDDGETARENIGGPIQGAQWNQADTLLRLKLIVPNKILNIASKAQFSIYPNPAKNEIRINSSSALQSIEIYSVEGKLVLKVANPVNLVNISLLQSGLYSVKAISTNGNVYTQKLLKR